MEDQRLEELLRLQENYKREIENLETTKENESDSKKLGEIEEKITTKIKEKTELDESISTIIQSKQDIETIQERMKENKESIENLQKNREQYLTEKPSETDYMQEGGESNLAKIEKELKDRLKKQGNWRNGLNSKKSRIENIYTRYGIKKEETQQETEENELGNEDQEREILNEIETRENLENEENIKEIKARIEKYRKELEEIWKGKETEAAEVERRNLRNLIANNQKELDQLIGKKLEEVKDPEETLDKIKETKQNIKEMTKKLEVEKNVLHLRIEKLEDERKNYESKKNIEYKGIYEEYGRQIEEVEKEIKAKEKQIEETKKEIDVLYKEQMDKTLRSLTQGKINTENEIDRIKKEIKEKQREVSEIKYGTEDAMEEKTLTDGTTIKVPRVNSIYAEIDKLQEQLKNKEQLKDEFQKYINEVKGIEEPGKTEYTEEQIIESTKYFHGQGDIPENTRDDRRANDEYFGFEGRRNKNKITEPREKPEVPGGTNQEPGNPEGPGGTNQGPGDPEGPGGINQGPDDPEGPGGIGEGPDDPNEELPLRSGLQVYREVLNDVGYIKGTKAIAAHDFIDKFNILGINKLLAWGIRKATGRKGEINRIVEILDEMQENNPEDFELLVKDFILKDNDTRNIKEFKVNEIFLMAMEKKCERDFSNQERELSEYEKAITKNFEEIQQKLQNVTPDERVKLENELIGIGQMIQGIHCRREELELRARRIKEGRIDKSYDRKDNIKGGLRSNRNPDNREEINELADIELKKLKARRYGDKFSEVEAQNEMNDYMDSKTEYTYGLNGKIKASKGAFDAKKSNISVITHRKNMTPELLGALSTMGIAFGVGYVANMRNIQANQAKVDQAFSHVENKVNQQIDVYNSQIPNNSSVSVDSTLVQAGEKSIGSDAIKMHAIGERTADLGSGYKIGSSEYVQLDAEGVGRVTDFAKSVESYSPQGNTNYDKLISLFRKKADLAQQGQNGYKRLQEAAESFYSDTSRLVSHGGVDHEITALLEQNASTYGSAEVNFYRGIADLLQNLSTMKPAQLKHITMNSPELQSTLIPLIAGLSPMVGKTADEQITNATTNKRKSQEEASR